MQGKGCLRQSQCYENRETSAVDSARTADQVVAVGKGLRSISKEFSKRTGGCSGCE